MTKTKLFASLLLVLAVLFMQVGNVAAAPQTQDGTTTIGGTVTQIGEPQTDANGVTTVLVTVKGADGTETTVRVSESTAAGLQVGQTVNLTVNAGDVIPPTEETEVNPISKILADFFFKDDPTMASVIDSYHTGDNDAGQVFGFGVITQALWMSKSINNGTTDAATLSLILQAKATGDYSKFTTADGSPITNWGQFKKAILQKDKGKHNLGVIVSGHVNDETTPNEHGKGKDNGKGKGQDKKNNP